MNGRLTELLFLDFPIPIQLYSDLDEYLKSINIRIHSIFHPTLLYPTFIKLAGSILFIIIIYYKTLLL
jgi:prolipoprotein diacylglyceryltransferase